jgi:hypothetical protein
VRPLDIAILTTVILSFAVLATAHLGVVVGLLGRPRRWRSVAALLFVPLAPYWAIRERMYLRAGAWLGAAVVYGVALGASR